MSVLFYFDAMEENPFLVSKWIHTDATERVFEFFDARQQER